MDRQPVALGPLGFVQEGDIGLGDVGMDVLEPHIHRAYRNGEVLEVLDTRQKVKEMVRG
jgi:hypothetical protein